jgi:hypothetical protein
VQFPLGLGSFAKSLDEGLIASQCTNSVGGIWTRVLLDAVVLAPIHNLPSGTMLMWPCGTLVDFCSMFEMKTVARNFRQQVIISLRAATANYPVSADSAPAPYVAVSPDAPLSSGDNVLQVE